MNFDEIKETKLEYLLEHSKDESIFVAFWAVGGRDFRNAICKIHKKKNKKIIKNEN